MKSVVRGGVLAALVGLVLVLVAGPASAHSRLESSVPADGASLATGPSVVTLTFNEQMQQGFVTLTVIGPGGTAYQDGETTASGTDVAIKVKPLGPAGVYQIGYRVVSEDGHPITGSVSFTLTTPGSAAAAPSSAPTSTGLPTAAAAPAPPAIVPADDGGTPVWPWIVGAVVLVGAGVVAALRLGKS